MNPANKSRIKERLTGSWHRCCVYAIANKENGKVYVGSTVNLAKRWSEHWNALERGNHHSVHLQRAWNKSGAEAFELRVLEDCAPDTVVDREQYWCDSLRSWDHACGYNIRLLAATSKGIKLSAETRAKMSAAHKGRKQTPEHAARQCAARRGKKHDLSKRIEMGAVNRRISPETAREVKRLLQHADLTQSQIASQCGVTDRFVSKVKFGQILWVKHLDT